MIYTDAKPLYKLRTSLFLQNFRLHQLSQSRLSATTTSTTTDIEFPQQQQ